MVVFGVSAGLALPGLGGQVVSLGVSVGRGAWRSTGRRLPGVLRLGRPADCCGPLELLGAGYQRHWPI